MDSNFRSSSSISTFAAILTVLSLSSAVAVLPEQELESALALLRTTIRGGGYALFANAVAASDLNSDVLAADGIPFTFFAPTDSSLRALDMTATAEDYVAAQFSVADLIS